jgi:hypothetical protein
MEVPQTYVRDAAASGRPCDGSVKSRCTVPVPTLVAFWARGGRSAARLAAVATRREIISNSRAGAALQADAIDLTERIGSA